MDEAWEKAVEAALGGRSDSSSAEPPRALTLDSAVKCLQGRLPSPAFFEKFQALEHLSIANVRLASLEGFPRLPALHRLILSDNRIAGGLEFLVEAGLDALRDLDLSNNRIQSLDALAPLDRLRLVSLDLYECPVTKIKDYRCRVFGLIPSLKYLDKMDADGNERPESDEDEEEDEEEYEDDEEEEEVVNGLKKGHGKVSNGVQGEEDGDEEEQEEEDEIDGEEGEEEDAVEEDGEEEDVKEEGERGEIDENGRGEDDENGEVGEEEEECEDDEEEDAGTQYVVQPIAQLKNHTGGSEFDVGNGDDDHEGIDDEQDHRGNGAHPDRSSCSQPNKRKRDGEDNSRSP